MVLSTWDDGVWDSSIWDGSIVIVDDDTHDGKYLKKQFDEDAEKARIRKNQIIQAYEHLVEGRPEIVQEITESVMGENAKPVVSQGMPFMDFDKLIADLDKTEQLWNAYLEMDDEEVVLLI
tara:strand:- start:1068 stop:1430 length:363 start_codon:yes stop_codon:yes gene_type:complete